MNRLLAVVLAGSLATGCTVFAPLVANGVQSTPRRGDRVAETQHRENTAIAFAAGLLIDAVLIAAALDFQDTLEHSGD